MGKTFFFFALFSASFANAAVDGPVHLAEGSPGCWDKFHGGAMTQVEINQLSIPCQNFRSDYFASTKLAQKNPGQLEKKLVQVLTGAKKARAPYEAIFLATILHTDKLKAALAKRAAVEKKLKVAFPYAEVASYRLSGKDCGANPSYLNLVYQEVCLGSDQILPAYFRSIH